MPRKAAVLDRSTEVVGYQSREPYISKVTSAAIQTVFNRTRLSHQNWESRQLAGRLDSRSVWRNDARGSVDIFRDRRLPSPTRLDVHLMVDASGSMMGGRICRAQDMAATLVDAFKRIPTVNVHVWTHSASGGHTTVTRVFENGVVNRLDQMPMLIAGGNADGFALEAIGQQAAKQKRPDTASLIIVISDGLPSVSGHGAVAPIEDHSVFVTQALHRKGVDVMAVAIAGDARAHEYMYGEGKSILFDGDWAALSRGFAAIFGKVLAKAPTHR